MNIVEKVKYLVTHLGGVSRGGVEQDNNSPDTPPIFSPRREVGLLRTHFVEGTFTIGGFAVGSAALYRLEESLVSNHPITQLIFSLVLYPWR